MTVTEFPKEVQDKIEYYVYRLIDPRNGETFYVGKGKGNRVFQHARLDKDFVLGEFTSDKTRTIRAIQQSGLDVIHVIHRHGLNEEQAIIVEACLIEAYSGTENIQSGHGSDDFGCMSTKEIIDKYQAKETFFEHSVILINVNRSGEERDLLDSVRFAWKLDPIRANKCEYVAAVSHGVIRGLFINQSGWLPATSQEFPELSLDEPNRYAFRGVTAPIDIANKYIGTRLPPRFTKRGAANPIKYAEPEKLVA